MTPRTLLFVRAVLLIGGGFTLFTGIALLFAPAWFLETIGTYPPFNRHYMGDLGAMVVPMGLGLLAAVRTPRKHRSLIGVVALSGLFHLLNHLYDDLIASNWGVLHFLKETLPLALLALLLFVVWEILGLETRKRSVSPGDPTLAKSHP